jgi:hypothetical protein
MPHCAAWFEKDHFADVVHLSFKMDSFIEHRLAWHLTYAADYDVSALTLGMTINYRQNLLEAHIVTLQS